MNVATEYRLKELEDHCAKIICQDVFKYRHELIQFAGSGSNLLEKALPQLFKAAGIQEPPKKSDTLDVENVWPLVCRALEAMRGWKNLDDNQALAEHYEAMAKMILDDIPGYPQNDKNLKKKLSPKVGDKVVELILDKLAQSKSITKSVLPSGAVYWIR
eukprot:gnl/TRDRNA2_/TRDRNA2_127953_c1_seq1.p1 gnl/TRDRNA2_/TRDRNA2_127953_c1~~gnl/TRDRNA2_/TRDRNA2_127953_c1_seq1.p1  ORF type:complete len:159 (+),score=30.35 gnl/TRDRNA2_/TRDRNA2_127953_c1_seq1:2-478(+)